MEPFRMTEKFMKKLIFEGSAQLGLGGFGAVYLVEYQGQKAALKLGKSKYHAESLMKERHALEQLQGAGGSPRALGYCHDPPALLMTYCQGRDLFQVVDQEPSDRACLGIMLRTCQALRQVHQAGFVHCDLKPDNVLVEMGVDGEPQEVHIIDLGLACRVGHAFPSRFSSDNKPWYCPCFFNGSPMQAACDVLSVAFTIGFFKDVMSGEYEELEALLLRAADAQH